MLFLLLHLQVTEFAQLLVCCWGVRHAHMLAQLEAAGAQDLPAGGLCLCVFVSQSEPHDAASCWACAAACCSAAAGPAWVVLCSVFVVKQGG